MAGKFNLADHIPPSPPRTRDIETVTEDVLRYKAQAGGAILSIGQCLNEAKTMLEHGEWTAWLTDRVEFSERTAQRFMRLANEWTNPTALSDLGASKALSLLAIPAEEREDFINTPHPVGGEEKLVADMTSRELDEAIRAKKKAEAQAAELEQKLDAALAANRAKIEAAADLLAQKKSQVEQLQQELAAGQDERRVKALSNEDTAEFKVTFAKVQEDLNRLHGLLLKIRGRGDEETAGKLTAALAALADLVRGCAEGRVYGDGIHC